MTSADCSTRLRLEERGERDCGRHLSAVEERQSFLRSERQRRKAALGEGLGGRHAHAAERYLADADERRRHVGERRQIARRTDRALRRNDRQDAALEEDEKLLDRRPADAGSALREAGDLERHDQAHDRLGQRLAGAGGVRDHEIALERGEIAIGDADAGELAEAGIDPVHRLAFREDLADGRGAGIDERAREGGEGHRGAFIDRAPVVEPHRARPDLDYANGTGGLCRAAG